ncbi:hypothetical protein TNCV_3864661 [Trichonephila clavipes]|nr:hypothetical protein TNCV_3864661 [Trichonephila clavipes]
MLYHWKGLFGDLSSKSQNDFWKVFTIPRLPLTLTRLMDKKHSTHYDCDFRTKISDPVDDETDEDEDNNNNESSKGPSNADAFYALETAMEWYEQQSALLLNYCC